MPNNKTPRKGRSSKAFYEVFWKEFKDLLLKSFTKLKFANNFLCCKDKTKLTEKKESSKRFTDYWILIQ